MYPCLLLKALAGYDLQLCACSKRDSCILCSCRPSEGIHAQVTSQRGSGAPGKTGSFTLAEVPVGTLHTGGGNLIPGVLHTGEGDRSFPGTLRTGEEKRKKNLPGSIQG